MIKKIGYGVLAIVLLGAAFIGYQWHRFNDQNFVADKSAAWYQSRVVPLWEDGDIPYYKDPAFSPDNVKWPFSLLADDAFELTPTMLTYPIMDGAPKPAIMILPGGGYLFRAEKHEGINIAEWLNSQGIAAFVVNYRLSPYIHPVPLLDAQRAMRLIRERAEDYNIDPARLGVMGFSAGGHLGGMVSTRYTGPEDKPAFAMLGYGVLAPVTGAQDMAAGIYMKDGAHVPDMTAMSPELFITPDTPPTFLWHTKDDPVVHVSQSEIYHRLLKKQNVPTALHLFEEGGHGISLATDIEGADQWPGLFIDWLDEQGFLNNNK